MRSLPTCWTIAGTDPSGGAGIQADLKVMNRLGVHGCSVITAIVAQNSQGVRAVQYPSPALVQAQLDALQEDMPADAIKIGMLGGGHTLESVVTALEGVEAPAICDPVLASSSGVPLLEPDALDIFRTRLLPLVHLLTPNIPEAEQLLATPITSSADIEAAAEALRALGPHSVLLKGGHADSPYAQDYWTDGRDHAWLTLPRQDVAHTHGTGCVLSSAIASCMALGLSNLDAVVVARAYLHQGLRTGGGVGQGAGPLGFGDWPATPQDLPWLTPTALEGKKTYAFPSCGSEPLGLYPIVDRAERLEPLLARGIRTAQLRAKDLQGEALEREVVQAIALGRTYDARVFINDAWQLAIEQAAYGVHLGQDDLPTTDLDALASAGLRLGISTHSYAEIARAHACRPSYIALGTLFRTTSKVMDYAPLGIDAFRRMRRLLDVPVVAIGGIHLENAAEPLAAGADGFAVISELRDAEDLPARLAAWERLLRR